MNHWGGRRAAGGGTGTQQLTHTHNSSSISGLSTDSMRSRNDATAQSRRSAQKHRHCFLLLCYRGGGAMSKPAAAPTRAAAVWKNLGSKKDTRPGSGWLWLYHDSRCRHQHKLCGTVAAAVINVMDFERAVSHKKVNNESNGGMKQ